MYSTQDSRIASAAGGSEVCFKNGLSHTTLSFTRFRRIETVFYQNAHGVHRLQPRWDRSAPCSAYRRSGYRCSALPISSAYLRSEPLFEFAEHKGQFLVLLLVVTALGCVQCKETSGSREAAAGSCPRTTASANPP